MKKSTLAIFAAMLLLFTACTIEAEKINYGADACHFCKMTIVDQRHAAQYVTQKGKQFKYDAIECLLNELSETGSENVKIVLVSDYMNPGVVTDATTATYLVSEEIKSPMGAFLTGFAKYDEAKDFMKSDKDKLYTWQTIKQKFSVK
ncbi:MAG: nitrous oxide reductase accessory protein NosL [Urechidicola sp.]|nr:nitrous oxide reductase accessory protein NosL [Urechidicola sp.]